MNIKLGVLAAAGLFATVGLTFGCGDSAGTGGAGTTGTTTGTTSSSKATTGVGTSTSTGGANDCTAYCASIATNCTGANVQFANTAACMTACMPLTPGTPGATSGASLACHIYHAAAAAGAGAAVHCWHAAIPSVSETAPHTAAGPCN